MDFAENYSFHVQNAIQAYHWANTQATLHPYVIYFTQNGKQNHDSFVIISEKLTHDTSSVHLFNSKVIEYLKQKFGYKNVKKIYYFTDGAASQYKKKYIFINLLKHRENFGISAQWNFFATAHGKGAIELVCRELMTITSLIHEVFSNGQKITFQRSSLIFVLIMNIEYMKKR